MTGFRLIGAALAVSVLVATPASAWEAISEPAAAATQNPNFSIYSDNGYSNGGGAFAYSPPIPAQSFNAAARAQMWVPARPHRAHHAPSKHS